ncbi:acylase [Massilia kyonggiensis]|nr:acylase [Massilia kyonggiensis]
MRRSLSLASALLLAGCGHHDSAPPRQPGRTTYDATISRTAFGIPHIKADDERGLGFGTGYAYAQDNFCLLANEVTTVNGERAKYFGAQAATSENPILAINNLDADFFFRLMNDDASIARAWDAQPEAIRALVQGWVAGVNRYLAETGTAGLPQACRNGAWVRALTERDVMKLLRRMATTNGAMYFVGEINAAAPPGAAAAGRPVVSQARPRHPTASNAIALGKDATSTGQGMLLGQPHLPWSDGMRFYQLHLTIPGKLDVMGASLLGLPVVQIGFTQDYAWTHTTDTAAHYTLYALQLDSADPTRYLVDGRSTPMTRQTITVEVRDANGKLATQSRDFYGTRYGPVLARTDGKLPWSRSTAFALRDANLDNPRLLQQWHAMNRASTLQQVVEVNQRILGNPWNNTIAADKHGNTLFMDVTPVPALSADRLAACMPAPYQPWAAAGTWVLDGSTAHCDWASDPAAPQPGILAANALPVLYRGDYVQNANDSAWLANPAAPLTGYSPLVNQDGTPPGARTRQGLDELARRRAGGARLDLADLEDIALNNRIFLAQQAMDDVLALCRDTAPVTLEDGRSVDLADACRRLAAWNRTANLDSNVGLVYFSGLMKRVLPNGAIWAVPFDPRDPVHTPRQLKVNDPLVAALLRQALAGAVQDARDAGLDPDATLGQLQAFQAGTQPVPIHGAPEHLGIYNVIESGADGNGHLVPLAGTSYVQAVAFDGGGPRARALLSYSQSADPASPHYADQTQRFARKDWIALPFTEQAMRADPEYRTLRISGP